MARRPAVLVIMSLILLVAACSGEDADVEEPASAEPTPTRAPIATPSPTPIAADPTPTSTATPTSTPVSTTGSAPANASTPVPPAEWGPDPDAIVLQEVTLHSPVSKRYALPPGYVPPNLATIPDEWLIPGISGRLLRADALQAVGRMLQAAQADGVDIRVRSAYRSYAEQQWTFAHWVNTMGLEQAQRVSARPGQSEHQLGTAIDFASAATGWSLGGAFAETAEGRWLAANGHRFGFALSYPAGAEAVTGYAYEPWHYRYIGEDAAAAWFASGLPLISFLEQWPGR